MPTVWQEAGFTFRFQVVDCVERQHVHVTGNRGAAKIWLDPVELAKAAGYDDRQIGRILRIAQEHEAEWLAEWKKVCGGN